MNGNAICNLRESQYPIVSPTKIVIDRDGTLRALGESDLPMHNFTGAPIVLDCISDSLSGQCSDRCVLAKDSTCLVNAVVSMGRRNTFLKFTRRSLKT